MVPVFAREYTRIIFPGQCVRTDTLVLVMGVVFRGSFENPLIKTCPTPLSAEAGGGQILRDDLEFKLDPAGGDGRLLTEFAYFPTMKASYRFQ